MSNDPNILCVTPDTPELYGASRSLLLLLESWQQRGVPCTLCTVSPGALHERMRKAGHSPVSVYAPGEEDWRSHGSRFGRALAYAREGIVAARRVKRRIRESGASVLYVNTVTYVTPILAGRWAGVPRVVHMREIPAIVKSGHMRRRLKWWALSKSCARFIANSKSSRESLLQLGVQEKAIDLIYNGVDVTEFDPALLDQGEARRKIGVSDHNPLIVTVSRPTADKGGEELLRAAAIVKERVPEAKWLVVGGPLDIPYYQDTLVPLRRELGLDEMCRFTGVVPDIRPYLTASDVVAVASREETFGRVNIEGMALRKPVVAMAVGGVPEVIADGETGLLAEPRSAGDLASKILRLLGDKQLRETYGKAGRERVLMMFSLDAYAEAVLNVIRKTANSSV